MDNITVDLGDEPVERGTEAVLIGRRHPGRGPRPHARHDQLRGHVRHQPARAARAMSEALEAAREALAGETAWLVGGAVRDRLLGRDTDDIDLAVPGDPKPLRPQALTGDQGRGVRAQRRLRRLARGRARARLARRPRHAARRRHPRRPRPARLHDQRDGRAARRAASCVDPHGGRARPASDRVVRMVSAAGARRRPAAQPARDPDRGRARPGASTPPPAARSPANARGPRAASPPERIFAELKRVVSRRRACCAASR